MEAQATAVVESEAEQLRSVREVRSVSGRGWSRVEIDYAPGTRMDRAEAFLRERLASIREALPPGLASPAIERRASADEQSALLVLRADGPYTAESIRESLSDLLLPRLLAAPGVARAEIYGGSDPEIRIDLDREAVSRGEADPATAAALLGRVGGTVGLGSRTQDGRRMPVVLERAEPSPGALGARPIGGEPDRPRPLSSVARVVRGWERPERRARVDGAPAVQVVIDREPGTNVLRTAAALRRALAEARPRLPAGLRVEPLYDQSERIRDELSALAGRAGISVLAIFLVMVLAERRLRAPLVVLATVLFSALATFALFRGFGIGMNLVTLGGIALAFGMAVDNSIVVLENVRARLRDMRASAERRILVTLAAVREVTFPILAATMTTAVVLGPFLYLTEDLRRFYLPFVLSVCLSLVASLGVALTLTPLLSRWTVGRPAGAAFGGSGVRPDPADGLRAVREEGPGYRRWDLRAAADRVLSVPARALDRGHDGLVRWAVRRPWALPLLCLVLLAGSIWVFDTRISRGTLFPSSPDTGLRVGVTLPSGADLDETDALVSEFERLALEHPYRRSGYVTQVEALINGRRGSVHLRLHPAVAGTGIPGTLKDDFVMRAAAVSGADVSVSGYGSGFSTGGPNVSPSYQLRLLGPDFVRLQELAEGLGERIARHPRVRDVKTAASGFTVRDEEEMVVRPRREALGRSGVALSSLLATLQPALASDLSRVELRSEEGDLSGRVRLGDGRPLAPAELLALRVPAEGGALVRVDGLIDLELRPVQGEITRRDQQYERNVTFEFRGPWKVGNRFLDGITQTTELPPGYTMEEGSGLRMARRDERSILGALLLAVILIYMVSAALFESVRLPVVAILSVPFGFILVPLVVWALDEPFDRTAYVGLILLAGVAVNSALLYVHRAGALLRRTGDAAASARRAALERRRPILMTTATSVAGLLPLALGDPSAASGWRALSLSASAGLVASALVTLCVLPSLFAVLVRPASIGRGRDLTLPTMNPEGTYQ
jgi:HAE1 family hydrophobic/amphiphilic exporter-1